MRRALASTCIAAGALILIASCATPPTAPAHATGELPRERPGVHNVLEIDNGVISGSMPHAEDGFRSLQAMGVKTIISVDGSRPDIELARAHAMRYIHVPIQYNGIDDDDKLTLARALREAEGPVFFHCHHGMHRGPAAAAYALIACGRLAPAEGLAFMQEAGTSSSYPGLFEVVATAQPVDDAEIAAAIDAGRARIVEEAKVEGLVANMARAGVAWDHLRSIRDAGWMVPPDHPDLAPAAEAGILADIFRTLRDDHAFNEEPADYIQWMTDAHQAAQDLEVAFIANDTSLAADAMDRLGTACNDCHAAYRNE